MLKTKVLGSHSLGGINAAVAEASLEGWEVHGEVQAQTLLNQNHQSAKHYFYATLKKEYKPLFKRRR